MNLHKEDYIYNLTDLLELEIFKISRITEDLHDVVFSKIFGIRLNLEYLSNASEDVIRKEISEIVLDLNTLEQDTRNIFRQLTIENMDFLNILQKTLEYHKKISEIEIFLLNSVKWENINNLIKINLIKIIFESLSNIQKHSKATKVSLDLLEELGIINITIKDNGIGFLFNDIEKGCGLKNIYSRANNMKARLDISSSLGHGTSINLLIPINYN